MNNQQKAFLCAAGVVLCWSTVATAFKIALAEMSYAKLLLLASFTALIIFLIDVIRKNSFRQITRKNAGKFAALGLLNPFLYYLVLFKAYSLLPAQVAQPLNYLWQIVLLLLSIPLLGTKVSKKQIVWFVVCFVGIVFISLQGSLTGFAESSIFGIILALSSAFIWALYWIFNNKTEPQTDSSLKLFVAFAFGFLFLLAYCALFDDLQLPSIKGVTSAVYVGVFEMGITFILWARALALSTNRAAVISLTYLSPVLSLVLIFFVLGEILYWTTLVGFGLIILGTIKVNKNGTNN
ncbi:Permease of the drug/metabolite transporter (DMT) superfamily [Mucinivorans hirudinis]|uniref:Permease of the drug/metabolite transporter (DMT) superfamily n=1 Tax=Mucinivorans hirudinis TaxID=1433126 RepID=A0A060R609_9BACT|nr:Permease of the drug/metabolite transporter (DMT) superfamily [Mucinivorans hirudinis]